MMTLKGAVPRTAAVAAITLILLAILAGPTLAGDEEKPAVNGKNSKIQLSGTGWFVYRYLLADEVNATAPKGFLSVTGKDRQDANSFDLDRVQVTGDYFFNDRISWRTVLEGDNLGGAYRLYIKNGYARVKEPWGLANTGFNFGLFTHAMTATIDDLWGYRLVSENSINRYMGVSSAFSGVSVDTKLADGAVNLDVAIANEYGYAKAAADGTPNRSKYKSFMGRVILTPPSEDPMLKSFHLGLWAQMNGKNPTATSDTNYVSADLLPKSSSDNQNFWFEVFPHFKNDKLAVGFEYVLLTNKYTRLARAAGSKIESLELKSSYIGGVVTYQATPKINAFARVDLYDPDTDNDATWSGNEAKPAPKNLAVTNIMAGLSHSYAKGVRSVLDVEYSMFEKPTHQTAGEFTLDPDITVTARMEFKL